VCLVRVAHLGALLLQTAEDEPAEVDDDAPMTLTEFQDSIHRVLGADLPLGDVTRLSRYGFQARQAERYRDGRILLAGDAVHQFPATGIGINFGMLDAVNLAWKLAAKTDHRPADALLIRPDAHIAWAATTGEPAGTAAPALREALSCWFGTAR
jgi:2-polyprenyl-6-methoxyphenol hydroxylase-like FAD-dependent oxidoreductase